ncbi:hypothetical protein HMPREF9946_00115 [Acetobacteraceae bacterium AT-5844]|nr:hypothetical protein HMPREF9946_00115 [Acetobacteraceae bacterium AT-5844]
MDSGDQEQRIRERAYLLWRDAGQPEGGADSFWYRAKELIEDEEKSAYPPSQSRGNRS